MWICLKNNQKSFSFNLAYRNNETKKFAPYLQVVFNWSSHNTCFVEKELYRCRNANFMCFHFSFGAFWKKRNLDAWESVLEETVWKSSEIYVAGCFYQRPLGGWGRSFGLIVLFHVQESSTTLKNKKTLKFFF